MPHCLLLLCVPRLHACENGVQARLLESSLVGCADRGECERHF